MKKAKWKQRQEEKRQRAEAQVIYDEMESKARELALRETLQMEPIYRRIMERCPVTGRERDTSIPLRSPEGPYYSKPYGLWPFRKRRMWMAQAMVVTLLSGTDHRTRVVLPNPMWASGSIPA